MNATAEVLKNSKAKILQNWEAALRNKVPTMKNYSSSALLDSMPDLIDQVIDLLNQKDAKPRAEKFSVGHALTRAEIPEYTIDQIIEEYFLLQNSVLSVAEEESPTPLRDRDLILEFIFDAIRRSVENFSEQRQREKLHVLNQSLAEVETRHELLVESVKDYAIFTVDPNGYITTWNPGCLRMKQYTSEEAIGHHFRMLYPFESQVRKEPEDHLKSSLIEGRFRGEGVRQKKDGTLFLADVTITPLFQNGVHVGFGKVVANLDEKNRLVQERDLSRTETEVLRIEQDLRDRFVHTLTHDLRTPLSAAKMGAQIIDRKRDTNETTRRLARRVIDSLDRMDKMIRDLLDASRIKVGEPIAVDLQKTDLAEIVSDVCDELSTVHGDRFKIDGPASLVGFWCPSGLTRVLENLMSNAVKYGDPNGPVTIRYHETNERVILSVHNHGNPISSNDQESIFEQFRRTKSAEEGNKRGWGLGLTLVRGLVEANKGMVKVESYPKEGTRFMIDLPIDARNTEQSESYTKEP